MQVVIECGSKQYRVSKGDTIDVEKLDTKPGEVVTIKKVLLVSTGKSVDIGTPFVKNASVSCEVVRDKLADKVIAYKYRRRKSYHRKVGHRQQFTTLKVKEIKVD